MSKSPPATSEHQLLAEWVHEHGRAVRGYLLAMVRRDDVADDLWQDVFRKAWQARQRYQETGAARAYLIRIADRLVCERARKLGREVNLDAEGWEQFEPAVPESEPHQALLQDEARQQLAAALEQISPIQRRVLLLRYYGELDFAEIAQTLECPLSTALSHCRRGLLSLRKILGDDESSALGG